MPARTTRQQARERIQKMMNEALDRMIPPDDSAPLKGSTFRYWEDQAAQFRRAVLPTPSLTRRGGRLKCPAPVGPPSPKKSAKVELCLCAV